MATTRYVSTTGNDGNSGTSSTNALRRISKAVAVSQAGDTIKILGGVYHYSVEGTHTITVDKQDLTIEAYDSNEVILDGSVTWNKTKVSNPYVKEPGKPTRYVASLDPRTSNPAGANEYSQMLEVTAPGVTIQNLTIRNAGGEGVRFQSGGKNGTAKNLKISWCFGSGLRFESGGDGGTAERVEVTMCSRKGTGYSLGTRYAEDCTFTRCTVSRNQGEGISCVQAEGATFTQCYCYDGYKVAFYCDTGIDVLYDRCVAFYTQDQEQRVGVSRRYGAPGFHISAEAYPKVAPAAGVTIKNCLAVNCDPNLLIQGGWQANKGTNPTWGMRAFRIFHNTFVDAQGSRPLDIHNKVSENNANNTACWFVNNLIVQRNSAVPLPNSANAKITDYSKWVTHSNVWSTAPANPKWPDSNDTVDTSDKGGLASGTSYQLLTNAAAFDIDDYKIDTDSDAKNAATTSLNAVLNVTKDHFNSDRPESNRDVGMHEFDGTASADSLVAGIGTDPGLTITAGDTIDFSDDSTENGAASVERQEWIFQGGSPQASSAASPTVTFATAGVYQVTYRVWDDTLGLSSTATATVTVQVGGTSGDSFVVGVVSFDAGDETVAHGMDVTPAACILQYTAADTDNTATSGAAMSIGAYSAQTGEQALTWTVEYDGGASANQQKHETDLVVYDKLDDHGAAVSSIDGTNLNLEWSGSGASGKGTAIFFAGSGIEAATVQLLEFPSGTSDAALNQTISGQYNLAFVPSALYDGNSGGLSWGFAAGNSLTGAGLKMSCGANSANRAGTERAATRDDAVATHPNKGITVTPSFGATTLTMTRAGGTTDPIKVVALAMRATGVEVDVGTGQLPSSDVATDYATSFSSVGALLATATANTSANSAQEDVPSLSAFAYDGTTQRSQGIYNTSGTAAVGKSYTDDALAVYDGTADAATTATASFGADKFTMTPTGAAGTHFAYIAFSEATTGVAPQAAFGHSFEEGHLPIIPLAGQEITFYDLSQDGSGTIDEWDWDWGDGSAHGTTQNPTHTYDEGGAYTVTLTVTDDDDETDSVSRVIQVGSNFPTIDYTFSAQTAVAGDTVTVDWSDSTWSGTTIDFDESAAALWTGDGRIALFSSDDPASFTVSEAGVYNIGWSVVATGINTFVNYPGFEETYDDQYDDALTVYPVSDLSLYSLPPTSSRRGYVGPIEIDFVLSSNRADITEAEIDWDWGDTESDADAGVNVSHEYDAVETTTAYTLTIDVTYPDGTEDQLELTGHINIVPEFVPPIPLATLAAMWNTYQAHLGDLSDATWVREAAPNTNVWKWEASYDWASNITPRLFENGTELTARASVALCQANPGSYYATNSGGDIVIYVHPTDSDNPNLNEERYRWID